MSHQPDPPPAGPQPPSPATAKRGSPLLPGGWVVLVVLVVVAFAFLTFGNRYKRDRATRGSSELVDAGAGQNRQRSSAPTGPQGEVRDPNSTTSPGSWTSVRAVRFAVFLPPVTTTSVSRSSQEIEEKGDQKLPALRERAKKQDQGGAAPRHHQPPRRPGPVARAERSC